MIQTCQSTRERTIWAEMTITPEKANQNGTSWFTLNDGNYLPHECRLHYLLECHVFGIMLTAVNSGRGWQGDIASFVVQHLGLALVAKRAPIDHRPSKRSIIVTGVSVGKQPFFFSYFFLNEPIVATLKVRLQRISRKDSKIWLHRADIKSIIYWN